MRIKKVKERSLLIKNILLKKSLDSTIQSLRCSKKLEYLANLISPDDAVYALYAKGLSSMSGVFFFPIKQTMSQKFERSF